MVESPELKPGQCICYFNPGFSGLIHGSQCIFATQIFFRPHESQSTEARIKVAEALPRFEFGRFNHILISPILKADFDPDVIIFYGNGAQVMRMIQAAVFASGESLTSKSTGAGGCLLPIVAPMLKGECNYTVPGNGERRLGLIADGELAFAMPKDRFEEVVSGLKLSHEGRQTYPISPGYLKLEYTLPPSYAELRKALIESSN